MGTTRQRKARERREAQVRIEARRIEGHGYMASMTCPHCGQPLTHNNSLAGSWWLQCLTPQSLTPGKGCGWQFLFEKE